MQTITPNTPAVLPVDGGLFPGNPGQSQSGETWDIVYCPTGQFVDFTNDDASNTQTNGCSVVYDPNANTLTVTMAPLAAMQAINAGSQYGTWVVLYDTQPGGVHVAGAGRSAYFTFAASQSSPPPGALTLSATPQIIAGIPSIQLSWTGG